MRVVYQCSICDELYETEAAALECEQSTEAAVFAPGDVVTFPAIYTWYDGDSDWVLGWETNDSLPNGTKPGTRFYNLIYVVTAVTRHKQDRHRKAYHVQTLAFKNHAQGSGFFSLPYKRPRLLEVKEIPDSVRKAAKALIGEKYSSPGIF